ncbi:hypothetical protein ILYODFUR_023313 [Ilyodon furcidens]|uniref:Uncharacterized protein n=1 Tax=Ilyodon furcidens TaxID=33524 RepID=A0ABV0T2P3_9TELE
MEVQSSQQISMNRGSSYRILACFSFLPRPPMCLSQLFPPLSLSLPQQGSSTRLHRHPSGLIHNLRFSAGIKVGAELQQPSTLPEHPSHNAPHFPHSMLCLSPTLAP